MMCVTATAFVCALAAGGTPQAYVFGGIGTSPGDSWNWTGPGLDSFRAKLADPAVFGPSGVVSQSATTTTLASVDAASLQTIDCFVAPALRETDLSAAQVSAIVAWFYAGGDVLLFDDRNDFDPIGEALGFPTLNGPGVGGSGVFQAVAVGSGPLVNGPFGTVATFSQISLVGHLDASTITQTGGSVAATNSAGVAVAVWNRGLLSPTAGRLVIVTDVDTFADSSGYPGAANYDRMNSNARLGLNTAAWLVKSAACPFDLDGDGLVTAPDLALLLGQWGSSGTADFNANGSVGAEDLAILLGAWGACP